jgi:long-subunit acyl-CoA synthetase (AMP-forming)
MEYYRG